MSKEIDDHILQFYEPKKLLGSGAYGHVWKVIDKRSKRQYALKKIFDAFQNSTDAQRTYRQISILTQIQHSNIIKMHKVIRAKNNRDLYILFQFMEADLHSLVGEGVLEGAHLKFITYQILKAMKYLHSALLLHRDLKPSNVLINSECQIKICDFGLARTLTCQQNQQIILSEEVATRWYRSPQMLLGSTSYAQPTDVWSIGCIVAELLIGKPIFPGTSTLNQLQKIIEFTGAPSKQSIDSLQSEVAENLISQLSTRKKHVKEYFRNTEPDLIGLVVRMLEFNPHKRITIQEALKLPLLKQFMQKQDEGNFCCSKFIVPCVDDNVKLTLQQYRKIIYQDIERRYPEENNTFKSIRSVGSFTKVKKISVDQTKIKHSPTKMLKRQKSTTNISNLNKKAASLQKLQILKAIQNGSPYKAVILQKQSAKLIKAQENMINKLTKCNSRKLLKKKGGESHANKFKK